MSQLLIRQALENHLAAMAGTLPTAWENIKFEPTSGVPFQRAHIMPSETVSPTMGGGTTELVMESGLLQVSLYYPLNKGLKDILAMAEVIRAWFKKGTTMAAGSVSVQVTKRASVAPAQPDGEWVVCPVSIPYFSNLFV